MAAAGSSEPIVIEISDSPDPPPPTSKRSRSDRSGASSSVSLSDLVRGIPPCPDRDHLKTLAKKVATANTPGAYLQGLSEGTPPQIIDRCRYMLHIGIDTATCSGKMHGSAQTHCPGAKLSIITNEQSFQHTIDAWKELSPEFSVDRYLPHLVNALPFGNVLTNTDAGISDPSKGVEGYLPAQYQQFCAGLFAFVDKVPHGEPVSLVGFGYPMQMLLDLGKFDPAGCIDPRKARPEGTSAIAGYKASKLPYGEPRAKKATNAAYEASPEHKDGSAIYEVELRRGIKQTVVGRLLAVAFRYPRAEHGPSRESTVNRAYAYSCLLRRVPTVKNKVLHIVYEHCV